MKISILCITYNHYTFVRDALDSFLAQSYKDIEIVISDDNSTDGTRDIILEYKKLYGNKFKIFLNDRNIGMMPNFLQALNSCTGDYIAICEGDDYWTCNNKLQIQFDMLEKFKQCSYCFHEINVVDEFGKFRQHLSKGRWNNNIQDGVLDSRFVVGAPLRIVHVASLLFRRTALPNKDYWGLFLNSPMGDYQLVVALSASGNAYYLKTPMAAYRINSASISHTRSVASKEFLNSMKATYEKIDSYFGRRFHKEIMRGFKGHVIMNIEANMDNAVLSRSVNKYLYYSAKLLIRFKGGQYNLKDVLWLIKEGLRKMFNSKLPR